MSLWMMHTQKVIPFVDSISKFINDLFNIYYEKVEKEGRDDVPADIIISLMDLILLKNKKECAPKIEDIVSTLFFFESKYINKKGRKSFSLLFQDKFYKIPLNHKKLKI